MHPMRVAVSQMICIIGFGNMCNTSASRCVDWHRGRRKKPDSIVDQQHVRSCSYRLWTGCNRSGFSLQQDNNAHPHHANIVEEYHDRQRDYTHLEWPLYIPDCNPVEYSWNILGRAVATVNP